MSAQQLYTCVAKCSVCNTELDRAAHVPDAHRNEVGQVAPLTALCKVKEHNTAADHNLNFLLEWYRETPAGLEFLEVVTPKVRS